MSKTEIKLAYTLHRITTPDGSIDPDTVTEFEVAEFDRLKGKGAVRDPSEDEQALYEAQQAKKKAKGEASKSVKAETPSVPSGAAAEARKELVRRAEAAGVKFHPNTGDEKLAKLVADAEKAAGDLDLTTED